MDGLLKELAKLERIQTFNSNGSFDLKTGKPTNISGVLDSLLVSLQELKQRVEAGDTADISQELAKFVQEKKKDVDDKQKEIHSSLNKLGKAVDKKFPEAVPSYPELFKSDEAIHALEKTIINHFIRTGQFGSSEVFHQESGVEIDNNQRNRLMEMHSIIDALANHDVQPALRWVEANRTFLLERSSPLEFQLHRSHFLRVLSSPEPESRRQALDYLQSLPRDIYETHSQEMHRLITSIIFHHKLDSSPYADFANPTLHSDLRHAFAKEYCACLGLSKHLPLRIVGDIGGGGAISKIEKGRRFMMEKKSEWSQTNELPIEIALPPENRYHSVFACPVSKEQATETNPPMMMGCGHVVNKDSLEKLKKPQAFTRVKCPYCPIESFASSSLRVHF